MSDINRSWRTGIAVVMLILCWLLIWWIVVDGDPKNSLHTSALAWAFATAMGIMAGLGFGAIVNYLPMRGS